MGANESEENSNSQNCHPPRNNVSNCLCFWNLVLKMMMLIWSIRPVAPIQVISIPSITLCLVKRILIYYQINESQILVPVITWSVLIGLLGWNLYRSFLLFILNQPSHIVTTRLHNISPSIPSFVKAEKNIEIDYHFILEKQQQRLIQLFHVDSQRQLVDIVTKPLGSNQFFWLIIKVWILNIYAPSWGRVL